MNKFLKFRIRQGFAMIFVILIALAMIIPVLILASSTIPRRTAVTGEAISDRVLAVGDATVDKILAQINTFPYVVSTDCTLQEGFDSIGTYYTNHPPTDDPNNTIAKTVVSKYAIAYLLSTLNGGAAYQPTPVQDPAYYLQADVDHYEDAKPVLLGSLWDIEDNVSTYLYDMNNQEYYAVWDTTNIASINSTGISGDIITESIKNLATGDTETGIAAWDLNYATDNRWVEIDTNTQYEDDGSNAPQSTKFKIRVSAYPLSSSYATHIVRNLLAEATLQSLDVSLGYGSESGPYDKALWSGHGLTINGNVTVAAADSLSNALNEIYIPNLGDIYASGEINAKAGKVDIRGIIFTSLPRPEPYDPKKDPIVLNQNASEGGREYNHSESLLDFPTGTEESVKSAAIGATGPYTPGNFSASNTILDVNGSVVEYYIDGNVDISNSTIYFSTITGPNVDWYINGNLTLDGTTLDFGDAPGIIWVNGDITFKSGTIVKGSGTIVANGKVTFLGKSSSLIYENNDSMIAIISEGYDENGGIDIQGNQNFCGLFYAPHSNIIKGGNGKIFGSLIAGGYISSTDDGLTINGADNYIIYDPRWKDFIGWLPEQLKVKGVQFSGSVIYRFSWKEIISKPVTNSNIEELNPVFIFIKSGS